MIFRNIIWLISYFHVWYVVLENNSWKCNFQKIKDSLKISIRDRESEGARNGVKMGHGPWGGPFSSSNDWT